MDAIKFHILLGHWAQGQSNHKLAKKHIVKAASLTKKALMIRTDFQAAEFDQEVSRLIANEEMIGMFNKAKRRLAA